MARGTAGCFIGSQFAKRARKSRRIQVGLAAGRVLLGDDAKKKSRALPRGPGVSAGGRGKRRRGCQVGPGRQPEKKGEEGARLLPGLGRGLLGRGEEEA